MLASTDRRPDPLAAFRIARRWFLEGRRIEMQELATELGINRATLFRWVGSRDELIAEILWSLAEPTLKVSIGAAPGHGAEHIARAVGHYTTVIDESDFFQTFLRREPERALRILAGRAGTVQSRLVAAIEELLNTEIAAGQLDPPLPPRDLAFLIVRIVESFLYADIITGEPLAAAKAEQAIGALLGHRPG
ncbi:QsdR family transcriptional regulator [Mycolicibacterium aubagnense]|nr:QsdR family transcriptional regulator [Mycolicibacterium aubagnense]TLH49962.1 TetR family transcriptional regulator [Mycolicibacterium aubagnense]WGI33475.1 QsdR family transcriptional regulator [Mycolicibacterium aubagnense]